MDSDSRATNNVSREDLREELVSLMRRFYKTHIGSMGYSSAASVSEMQVLFAVEHANRLGIRLRPSMIAKKLRVSPSAVSQTLKALEDKRLVNRIREEGNSRSFVVVMTDQGKDIVSHACNQRRNFFNDLFEAVGVEDVHELVRVMRKIVEFCEKEQAHASCEQEQLCNADLKDSLPGNTSSVKGGISCG